MEKQNNIEVGKKVIDTNEMEKQFLRIDQIRGLLETLGSAVFYAKDNVSEENIYHSLNVAAEELDRAKENLYNLIFDEVAEQ